MKKKSIRATAAAILLVLVIVVFLLLPIKVPYRITVTGQIQPLRAWMLTRGQGGQIQTRSFNFEQGTAEDFSVIQFQRGEDMKLLLNPALAEKEEIAAGDTVGTIYSSEFERDVTRVRGELAIAREELKVAPNRPAGGEARLIQVKIDALEKELAVLMKRKQSFTLLAPFRSVIVRLSAPAETLLLLHDVGAHVVTMPIPDEHMPDLDRVLRVTCAVGRNRVTIERQDFSVGQNRAHLAGREVVIARGLISEQSFTVPSGMLVRCSIECQSVTLLEFVRRFIERMVV
jgi:hypothetical protein